jgi:hypothetical protein
MSWDTPNEELADEAVWQLQFREDEGVVRNMVEALVAGYYTELSAKDRFCGVCELMYSSHRCPNHEGYRGPQAAAGNVMRIHHQDQNVRVFFSLRLIRILNV